MSAHTSGPWVIHDVFPYQRIVAEIGNRVIVPKMGGDSVEADARLVASAPDLLEALQAIKEALDTYRRVQDWRPIHFLLENKTLEGAIAKATGEAATS